MPEGCTAERRSVQAEEQLWLKNKAVSTAVNSFGKKIRRRWVTRKACQGELWGQRNLTISDWGLKSLWNWFYGAEPMIAESWIYVSAGLIYFCSQFSSQIPDPAPLQWTKICQQDQPNYCWTHVLLQGKRKEFMEHKVLTTVCFSFSFLSLRT